MIHLAEKYDVIVVGAGPAGSVAARTAAEGGLKVLMLEKDRDIGIPVRCAEGVSMKSVQDFIDVSSIANIVDNRISKVRLVSPRGIVIHVKVDETEGTVLNRKVFDFELAKAAAMAGAQVYTRCYVKELHRENGIINIKFENYAKEYAAKAPVIIGADGVESMVGRWAGLRTNLSLTGIESCFQYQLVHPDIDRENLDFYFGNKLAPGGYVWVFPKGKFHANVGLGINGSKMQHKSAKEYLDDFVARMFPGASVLSSIAGSVPVSKIPKKIIADGIMLVGDAAHQANPISGGGIATGMYAGRSAGKAAITAHHKGDFSEKTLNEYLKAWNKRLGKEHNMYYRIKTAVYRLSDDTLDRTAEVLDKVPFEDRSIVKVFQTALSHEPGLIVELVKAFIR